MLKALLRPFSRVAGNGTPSESAGTDYAVDLRKVVKQFQTAAGVFTALKSVDFRVTPGEFVGVIGKSGSGKSTLINMITGIDRPTSGEVYVAGTPVHTLSEGQMAVWRGRHLGIVFQFFQLLPTLSLADNIMLPMDFCGMYHPGERYARALELLDLVGMADQAQKLPSAVSGGQQQRVAIARALANDPPILIADEPTGNLDSRTADSVFELFESLISRGKTILMVTHDNDLAKRVTRTIILSDGEIIEQYLARAFPALDEDQLVWATRRLETRRFEPGALIIRHGEPADSFYLITRGKVEVFITGPYGQELQVAAMHAGQYFGEVELLAGGPRIATVRAGHDTGVEVAAIDAETFRQMTDESVATRREIEETVQARIEENRAASEQARESAGGQS